MLSLITYQVIDGWTGLRLLKIKEYDNYYRFIVKRKKSVVIRKLQDNDYSEWFFLWKAYLEFYETTLNESIYKETFRRLISLEHNNQGAVVAEVDKKLVGLAHYIIHPHNWKFEDVIYLQDLFTLPENRLSGIGRALIEAVYKVADNNGTPEVYWHTQTFNEKARYLYKNLAKLTPFIMYSR